MPPHQWRSSLAYITFTVSFGLMVDLAAYGIIVPVLPFHLKELGYRHIPSRSSWLVAAYAAGLIISSIPIGLLGELVKSRKLPLLLCLAFLGASLVMFWLSTSFPVLMVSRVLQGLSGTGIWTLGLALICDVVPQDKVGSVMGYVMIGWSLGSVAGPLMGGVLYESFGYNSIFIFALVLAALDFLFRLLVRDNAARGGCQAAVPDVSSRSANGDYYLGTPELMGTPDTSCQRKKRVTVNGQENVAPLGSLSLLELYQKKPTTSQALLSLARSPRAWTLFGTIFVLGFAFGGLLDAGMTLVVNHRYDLESRGAGLVFIGAVVPSFVSSPLAGHLADKHGAKWPVVVFLLLGTPFFSLLSLRRRLLDFVVWIAFTGLFIMGVAAPIMEDLSQVVQSTPGLGYSHVYSIFNLVYSVGALVGPLCIGVLMQHSGIERGWRISCLICTALCMASIIPCWVFLGEKDHPTSSDLTTSPKVETDVSNEATTPTRHFQKNETKI